MDKIAIIGAGTMGNGIAHVCSQHDIKVTLVDIKQEFLDRAMEKIKKNMGRELKKERITQEKMDASLANITTSTSLDAVSGAEFVVEAATENLDIKLESGSLNQSKCPATSWVRIPETAHTSCR